MQIPTWYNKKYKIVEFNTKIVSDVLNTKALKII